MSGELQRTFRSLRHLDISDEPCLICGSIPTRIFVLWQIRIQGLEDYEWGRLRARLCRRCGHDRALEWFRRTAAKGWWNPGAFFPNMAATGIDIVALVHVSRMPMPLISASDSLMRSRSDLVDRMKAGMGERAWRNRADVSEGEADPTLKEALMRLCEAESWSLVRHDDD